MIFKKWKPFEVVWLSLFSLLAVALSVLWKDSLFGLMVFLTGVLCVVLTAKGDIKSFYFGFFNTLGYGYLAFNNQLFGEMGLNLFFFLPMNFIGYYTWKRHLGEDQVVTMRKMTMKPLVSTFLLTLASIGVMGYGLFLIPGQNNPFIDATTNVLSIVATFLTIKRYREQWLAYIVLNIFTIILWTLRLVAGSPDGVMMIVMWSAYLVNALYGYWTWSRGAKEKVAVGHDK